MKSLLTIALLAASASAAQSAEVVDMLAMTGACEALVIGGEDLLEVCHPNIIQTIYDNGRVGLYVSTGEGDGRMFSFSGVDGKSTDPDLIAQKVDMLVFSPEATGGEATSITVKGQCLYENPYAGSARIECDVTDKTGNAYIFEYVTDGTPPDSVLSD